MLSWIWNTRWGGPVLALALIFIVAPIILNLYVGLSLVPKVNHSSSEVVTHFPEILKDLSSLEKDPPFPDLERTKNADTVFTTNLSFDGNKLEPLNTKGHVTLRSLMDKYKWASAPAQLKKLAADSQLKTLNTDWVNSLKEFDYWDFSLRSEISSQLDQIPNLNGIARIGVFSALPVPNYMELRQWNVINLLKLHAKGKGMAGMAAYRKSAQLAHSSGTLIGNMVAAAMLKDEHYLMKALGIKKWNPVPLATIETYKRVSWAWAGVLRTPWFGQWSKDFDSHLVPQSGMCAGLLETLNGTSIIQDYLEPQFPFEPHFATDLANARDLHQRLLKKCGLERYTVFLTPTPPGSNPFIIRGRSQLAEVAEIDPISDTVPINWSRVPYLRRAIGLTIMVIAQPNYMRLYQEKGT
jgi:hypothetical protein